MKYMNEVSMKMYNVVFLAEDDDYLIAGPLTYEAAGDYCEHAEKYYEIDGVPSLIIERAEAVVWPEEVGE